MPNHRILGSMKHTSITHPGRCAPKSKFKKTFCRHNDKHSKQYSLQPKSATKISWWL